MSDSPPKDPRKYTRVRSLGTDGPFVVEVARPQQSGGAQRAVLLKRLRPGWPVSSQALKQFISDARSVSRVAHNNIVRVLDIAKDQHGPVLVTEYVHGVSLAAVLRQIRSGDPGSHSSLNLPQVLTVVRQACSGLKAAQASGGQAAGVIHGAVSPEHLMITFEGVVKIKDFGIFRMYPAGQRGSLGGPNPVYLSPEQEQGLQPGLQSDLFALGRVLQKLLSLYAESSPEQLPGEVTGMLSELLQDHPARRPGSAAELEPQLEALVRTHGSGHEEGRLQLGAFVRGLFKTETPASKASLAEDASKSQDVALLDPESFWDGSEAEDTAEVVEGGEGEVTGEVTGEAVVVSAPVGRPQEMFLPDSERIVVSPQQPRQPSPAPPAPQKDFLKVGRSKKPNFLLGGAAAAVLLLVFLAVWLSSAGQEDGAALDASVAGPVLTGGDEPAPPQPEEEPAAPGGDLQPDEPDDQPTGIIKLNSTPPGALVYINDEKKGVAPLTVRDAVLGEEVSIRVELEGHKPWKQTVILDEDNRVREFDAGLLKEEVCEFGTGWIYVTSEPDGGSVEMDGRRLPGKTPMIINEVCAGVEHEIRVQASGFRLWRKVVNVRPGKVLNLNVELER